MRRAIGPALVALALIALWEVLTRTGALGAILGIDEQTRDVLVPGPTDVLTTLWDDRGLLAENAWVTLVEVAAGFAVALACGVAFALAMHFSGLVRRVLYPLVVASQTIPIIAIAPILVIWLGYGIGPKLAVIALICFFPVTVNLLDGLRSVDPELLKLMRSLGASRLATLWKVELPWSLPFLFSGLRIAATVSVIGAVFGEWAGADEGLGRLVLLGNNQLQTPRVYAGIVILTLMAVALFALVALLERVAAPWQREGETTR